MPLPKNGTLGEQADQNARQADEDRLARELAELDTITFEVEDIEEVGVFAGSGSTSTTCSTTSTCSSTSC